MLIDIYNVLKYYGDLSLNALEEVLYLTPGATGFTFDGREYGTTTEELHRIMTYWNKVLRG